MSAGLKALFQDEIQGMVLKKIIGQKLDYLERILGISKGVDT